MRPNPTLALVLAVCLMGCKPSAPAPAAEQPAPPAQAGAAAAETPAAADADGVAVPAEAEAAATEGAGAEPSAAAAGASALQAARRIQLHGTEPFWGIDITGTEMHYSTPDNEAGDHFQVEREALADGGVRYTGEDGITAFSVEITPGDCSDGMSDQTYAYHAVFQHGRQTLTGCGRITVP